MGDSRVLEITTGKEFEWEDNWRPLESEVDWANTKKRVLASMPVK
jgi:hypothetical protein